MSFDEEAAMNGTAASSSAMTINGVSSDQGAGPGPSGISKNAMKKAAKQAQWEATKWERRAAEKARRKERKAAQTAAFDAGTLSAEELAAIAKKRQLANAKKAASRHGREGETWKGGVVIDLGFDDLMTDQEIKSMCSQLAYVYSANRIAPKPFSTVLHTSFSAESSPRLWEKMAGHGWPSWIQSAWTGQGLKELNQALSLPASTSPPTPQTAGDPESPESTSLKSPSWPDNSKLVYLTADSEEEITTLKEDEVYILGGLVDRNRHKMLCYNKAELLGIRTARLPIGEYIENLPTRKVLTVNQVFEILVQYLALQDWGQAFEKVIPQRKYDAIGKRGQKKLLKQEQETANGNTI